MSLFSTYEIITAIWFILRIKPHNLSHELIDVSHYDQQDYAIFPKEQRM